VVTPLPSAGQAAPFHFAIELAGKCPRFFAKKKP
jgi:hypothetical protein